MPNSIFSLSKYLKKSITTTLILGLMLSPILQSNQSIISNTSIAAQATGIEAQAEKTQAEIGNWSEYANTDWYNSNSNASTYTLTTADQLAGLAQLVNDGICNFEEKTIVLDNNIDLGEHYWVPIGKDNDNVFKGTFDGKNNAIENMLIIQSKDNTIEKCQYIGFFGVVEGATIKDLIIDMNSYINSTSITGGICAKSYKNTKIINCMSCAAIESSGQTGGICAVIHDTTVIGCVHNGVIYSYNNYLTGGICAWAEHSSISDCLNNGNINGASNYIGGIIGFARRQTTIRNCVNGGTGAINIDNNMIGKNIGGICGNLGEKSTISSCINLADLSSITAGRICGNDGRNETEISNCYYYRTSSLITGLGLGTSTITQEDQAGQTTALPYSQMIASSGVTDVEDWVDITVNGVSQGKIAMVDALNMSAETPWVQNNGWNNNLPYSSNSLSAVFQAKEENSNTKDLNNDVADEENTDNIEIADSEPVLSTIKPVLPVTVNINDTQVPAYIKDNYTGFQKIGDYYYYYENGSLEHYYTGWKDIENDSYYITNGVMTTDTWLFSKSDKKIYYIDLDGKMNKDLYGVPMFNGVTPPVSLSGFTYYYSNGDLIGADYSKTEILLGNTKTTFRNGKITMIASVQ